MTDSLRRHDGGRPRGRWPQTAFSLMEILVSLLVVAILVVLIGSAVSKIRASAGNARCLSNLRQLGAAITGFAADHDGMIPPGRDYTNGVKYWFSDPNMWAYQYLGQDRISRIFCCPLDPHVGIHKHYYSYTWNLEFLQDWPVKVSSKNPDGSKAYLRDASRKVLMADGESNGAMGSLGPIQLTPQSVDNLGKRHQGGANCLMGDSSVQWFPYHEILTPALIKRL